MRPFVVLAVVFVIGCLSSPTLYAACPDGMVEVGSDLCIDQFEAAIDPGGSAVSAPDLNPAVNISMPDAAQACAESGKRLCTSVEWLRACQGPDSFTYPYGNTLLSGVCNDSGTLARTGSYPECISAEGALDLVGNVREWVNDTSGTLRGGDFIDSLLNGPGCLNTATAHATGYTDGRTGFRCCCDTGVCGSPPSTNSPPVANAGPDQTIYVGQSTALKGTATDPDGDSISLWQWEVTTGFPEASYSISDPTSPDATFVADTAGTYLLTLRAWDGQAWSDPDAIVVTVVTDKPPTAVAAAFPASGAAPLTTTFDATESSDPEGGPLAYEWDFGDGNSGSGSTLQHTFAYPGVFHVVLTVNDAAGLRDTDALEIIVTASNIPPQANPSATPNEGAAPLEVQFAANAADPDGSYLAYVWDFGDPASADNSSSIVNPRHIYEIPGTYTAWLTVSDGEDEVSQSVTVVVSGDKALTTRQASVHASHPFKHHKGTISYWADFDLPIPGPDDQITLTFDGINLLSKPFSAFKRGVKSNVYLLVDRRLVARIDFNTNRIYVMKHRVNLSGFDSADGVSVEIRWGDRIAVDQFDMKQLTESVWRYRKGKGVHPREDSGAREWQGDS